FAVHRHRLNAHSLRRADHAPRDLAAVGDKQALHAAPSGPRGDRLEMPMVLARMPSITSSAPPPMEARRPSRYRRETLFSSVYPMPPQNCRQVSGTRRFRRPALSLAMVAHSVTSSPAT